MKKNKNNLFSRFIITIFTLALLFAPVSSRLSNGIVDSSLSAFTLQASAESWSSVSKSGYVEFKADSNIKVYKDSNFKTRGTCSPSKSYDAMIYKNDVCRIYELNSSYFLTAYPTSSGWRTGYIRRSSVTGASSPASRTTASGKAYTYPYPGASSWGYTENKDEVYRLYESGSYTQIIYTAKSGDREYKMAYVKTNDYNAYCAGSGQKQSGALSEALYKSSGAYISCGFDGYKNTSGRHEGIDVKYNLDANIYSLTDGIVLRVASGSTGSGGLSTIAIYNSQYDKTVIYLHAAPSVKAGDKVRTGDKIGKESWRGISSKSSSHTHVEVRNGKKEYAAKSVGDSTMDNSNPSSFWKSLGYSIK